MKNYIVQTYQAKVNGDWGRCFKDVICATCETEAAAIAMFRDNTNQVKVLGEFTYENAIKYGLPFGVEAIKKNGKW